MVGSEVVPREQQRQAERDQQHHLLQQQFVNITAGFCRYVGTVFGDHRLEAYLKEHHHESPQQLVKGLFETLKSYAGSFNDDITLLVIKAE